MSLFNCENCGVVENTALSPSYWSRKRVEIYDWTGIEERKGMALCSECAPTRFSDGKPCGTGKWHGKFKKTFEKI